MTSQELCSMPQCPSICPPQSCGPRFVQVQQPPRMVCQKKVVYCNKTVVDKFVVPETRCIMEPKLIYQPRQICEPHVIYKQRTIQEPKIIYCKKIVPDPKVVAKCRTVCEPKEICQTIMCRPKPQCIQIPPAKEFICSPADTTCYENKPGCLPKLPECCPEC
jgi:hypothetical protein